jgi:hypothetical protein
MAWRYTRAGKEFDRPNSETGLHVEGPLTVEDWKTIIVDILDEIENQTKRDLE